MVLHLTVKQISSSIWQVIIQFKNFLGARADSPEAKWAMYNAISALGTVSLKDIPK